MKEEYVTYDNDFTGYLAYANRAERSMPAVIVIQEAWGVDAHIEAVTRRIAAAGYVAFAPNLYARKGERLPGLERERIAATVSVLNTLPPQAWSDKDKREQALADKPELKKTYDEIFANLQSPDYPVILEAAANFLRQAFAPSRHQKLASIGFCMGGRLSALLAARTAMAGAVVFYGQPLPESEIPKVTCPVLGLYGALDKNISEKVPVFADAMHAQGKMFDYVIYDGAPHAFFNDTRPSYRVDSARDAFVRVLEFFREQLS